MRNKAEIQRKTKEISLYGHRQIHWYPQPTILLLMKAPTVENYLHAFYTAPNLERNQNLKHMVRLLWRVDRLQESFSYKITIKL